MVLRGADLVLDIHSTVLISTYTGNPPRRRGNPRRGASKKSARVQMLGEVAVMTGEIAGQSVEGRYVIPS
jgi:hypothetical protein